MNILNTPYVPVLAYRTEFDPTESKILSFGEFQSGWHYGEGIAFTKRAIEDAILLHRQIYFKGFQKTDAFPGQNGEIQITVYNENHYFQFERQKEGSWEVTHEDNNQEVEFLPLQSFDQALNYVNGLNSKVCDTYVLYTKVIGTPIGGSLTTWPSGFRTAAYQSSIANARVRQALLSVNT
ncbi:MAG TPA: hypothetical protein VFC44_10235 [Candidatus Saccharimonadales bacterium]|nr:hypothetical protein [Candidatus Saccharimonadales bacterium]